MHNAIKSILLCFLLTAAAGCKDNGPPQTFENGAAASDSIPHVQTEAVPPHYDYDTLNLEDALVNGHTIVMPQKEFEKAYPKLDSAKTDLWECGSPFGYLDGAWMEKTYGTYDTFKGDYKNFDGYLTTLFVRKASFASNGHIVLFDRADAAGNSFSLSALKIVLDKNTTVEAFERAFPKLKRESMEDLQEYRYRLPLGKESDDAFLFEFCKGKLSSFQLWWLLC